MTEMNFLLLKKWINCCIDGGLCENTGKNLAVKPLDAGRCGDLVFETSTMVCLIMKAIHLQVHPVHCAVSIHSSRGARKALRQYQLCKHQHAKFEYMGGVVTHLSFELFCILLFFDYLCYILSFMSVGFAPSSILYGRLWYLPYFCVYLVVVSSETLRGLPSFPWHSPLVFLTLEHFLLLKSEKNMSVVTHIRHRKQKQNTNSFTHTHTHTE